MPTASCSGACVSWHSLDSRGSLDVWEKTVPRIPGNAALGFAPSVRHKVSRPAGGRQPETIGTARNRKCSAHRHIPRHRPAGGSFRHSNYNKMCIRDRLYHCRGWNAGTGRSPAGGRLPSGKRRLFVYPDIGNQMCIRDSLRSMKTGKTYDGTVLLADTGGKYVNYREMCIRDRGGTGDLPALSGRPQAGKYAHPCRPAWRPSRSSPGRWATVWTVVPTVRRR